ncbi:type IV toxin-antitoxin system AbiEi family antitoxin [Geopsychrobacter electrodiphilus]|uniref:type IV toxin-antitoxin system AbiEi family antitoxin n=1 Tax=Geopsychrobacter electrodiphilus TaxID=225196 RepID=UPI00036D37C1|nr:type IV toxin-antitoxin system AbiEi family antitoxin [Geopsychrobacter electrodiphilus]
MTNKTKQRDEQIIFGSMKAIRSLPGCHIDFVIKKLGGPFAGTIKIGGDWGEKYYFLKVVPKLSPEIADLVIHQLKTTAAPANCAPLLLTHYVSPNLAAKLKQKKIEFADCAGNLLLQQAPLYVEIAGQRHLQVSGGLDRLFRSAGLKLIYLFLRNPQSVNASYRILAEDAGIALGAIGDIFKELKNRGNLMLSSEGRELTAAEDLLQRWQLGYLETLRPRMLVQRCSLNSSYSLQQLPELLRSSSDRATVMLGGQLGASLLTNHLDPESAVLYINSQQQQEVMLQLQLTPDPHGNVSLQAPFGKQNFWNGVQPAGLNLVDPILTYAELAGDSSCARAADNLYTQYILPRLCRN